MGNCICMRHDSRMVWAGDDWGSPMSERFIITGETRCVGFCDRTINDQRRVSSSSEEDTKGQRSSLLVVDGQLNQDDDDDDNDDDDQKKKNVKMNSSSTEVKVRITKKQLEDLLGNVDQVQGLSVQQLLEQLMNITSTHDQKMMMSTVHHLHRSWKPALPCIPEVIEAIF